MIFFVMVTTGIIFIVMITTSMIFFVMVTTGIIFGIIPIDLQVLAATGSVNLSIVVWSICGLFTMVFVNLYMVVC